MPNIGPAKAIVYDIKAIKKSIEYIKQNNIKNAIIYILACRIGPFLHHYKKIMKKYEIKLYINPDGHEWLRAKWSKPVKKYWKISEQLMVKEADLVICDSKNIEKYILESYSKYKPKTTFIAYGADLEKSKLSNESKELINWYKEKNVKPGNYLIKYYHSTKGDKDYTSGSNRAIILKLEAKVAAKDLTMNAGDGSEYKVTVKDKSGKTLGGVYVKSVIGGKQYLYKTDANGVAKLKITQGAGSYSVKTYLADPCYKSSVSSKNLLVKGTKFIAKNIYVSAGDKATFSVKLVNEKNKAVGNKDVTFQFEGKNTTVKTNSKGIAKVSLGVVSKGTHNIKFSQGLASGTAKIFAANKVSIKEIVEASKNVKKYISNHAKLPSTVKIGDISLKTADYLYLASKAIVNIKAGNNKDLPIKILNDPTNAKAATDLGYLKNYLSVAKSVVNIAESKGKLPDSVNSKVGTIGYKGLVSTFAKVLTSYGKNNKMPSYIAVKSLSGSSTSIKGPMNMKNTITALAAYLAASKNCEVNNAAIKNLVAKLTKNCKTEKDKANAIFTYVRDKISYSFYYNTKYGAAGTLKTKSGNCVDQAHLTVAMFRAAGLATRYVHAKCTFTSGHTYGHVFAQVLIGNTWAVADTTSSRNSLGKVANWNTNTYRLESFSSSISF